MEPLFIAVGLVVLFVVVNLVMRSREQGPSLTTMSTGSLETDIANLLGMGKKLEAIRLYRRHTGAGLAQAQLAIEQFVPCRTLSEIIGKRIRIEFAGHETDLIPLPHPSGASPWPRMEPGRSLLRKGMRLISRHPALGRSGR